MSEAFGVAAVVMIFLFSAGNLLSVRHARAVNPANSFRTGALTPAGHLYLQFHPAVFLPVMLAYLARYAFGSQTALFTKWRSMHWSASSSTACRLIPPSKTRTAIPSSFGDRRAYWPATARFRMTSPAPAPAMFAW